jgi:hypothetical protein
MVRALLCAEMCKRLANVNFEEMFRQSVLAAILWKRQIFKLCDIGMPCQSACFISETLQRFG